MLTKQPQATPYYSLQQQFGSYNFYRTTSDATGPLSKDGNLLYRFNMAYEDGKSFRTGLFLTAVFSIGAVLGATMTMSASVAHRTTEIGTLRTLGFTRLNILQAFLLESVGLGMVGGLLGVMGAALLHSVTISTTNFDTGAELVFGFHLAPAMVGQGLLFAVVMGIV